MLRRKSTSCSSGVSKSLPQWASQRPHIFRTGPRSPRCRSASSARVGRPPRRQRPRARSSATVLSMSSTSQAICVNVPGEAPADSNDANSPLAAGEQPAVSFLEWIQAQPFGVEGPCSLEVLDRKPGSDARSVEHPAPPNRSRISAVSEPKPDRRVSLGLVLRIRSLPVCRNVCRERLAFASTASAIPPGGRRLSHNPSTRVVMKRMLSPRSSDQTSHGPEAQ
jgi:hypothetical protein